MSTYLRLLGRPHAEYQGAAHELPAERRCQLLALLALRHGWVARVELAELLWPGDRKDRAATNLRKALHFARALPWAGALESQGTMVRFAVATDTHEIETAMREGRVADALSAAAASCSTA
jgi:DNA-binding SARP family transcriptional activator